MPPRRNMPQQRSVLTRSMSLNVTLGLPHDADTCFRGVEDDEPDGCRPRFDVDHGFFPPTNFVRVEKRAGMTLGKQAFRPNGKPRPIRMDSMKNLFSKLVMDDKITSPIASPEAKCAYCKSAMHFLYGDDVEMEDPEGNCTCAQDGPIARLVTRRTLSRIGSDGKILPKQVCDEEATFGKGPDPCNVVSTRTGQMWKAFSRGIIRVVVGGSGLRLRFWSLSGTMHGSVGYIFGFENKRGVWKYATVDERKGLVYSSHSIYPLELNIDTGSPVSDPRIFSLVRGNHSDGGSHLVPAIRQHLAVTIANGRLKLSPRREADGWRLDVKS